MRREFIKLKQGIEVGLNIDDYLSFGAGTIINIVNGTALTNVI